MCCNYFYAMHSDFLESCVIISEVHGRWLWDLKNVEMPQRSTVLRICKGIRCDILYPLKSRNISLLEVGFAHTQWRPWMSRRGLLAWLHITLYTNNLITLLIIIRKLVKTYSQATQKCPCAARKWKSWQGQPFLSKDLLMIKKKVGHGNVCKLAIIYKKGKWVENTVKNIFVSKRSLLPETTKLWNMNLTLTPADKPLQTSACFFFCDHSLVHLYGGPKVTQEKNKINEQAWYIQNTKFCQK